jgi:organic radical activating enzyme
MYSIKDVFLTVQGEGSRAGEQSVFVRFSGCNLWDGIPEHRHLGKGACARWCDTDFAHGQQTELKKLLHVMDALWPKPLSGGMRWCVLTGGEPLLQVESVLLLRLRDAGWRIAIETNGSVVPKFEMEQVDLLTCSPKRGSTVVLPFCDELKVVLPGDAESAWTDAELLELADRLTAPAGCFVNPQDPIDPSKVQSTFLHPAPGALPGPTQGEAFKANVQRCLEFVRANPEWRVGVQMHKYLQVA